MYELPLSRYEGHHANIKLQVIPEITESKIWQPLSRVVLPNYCLPMLTLYHMENEKREKGCF